MMTGLRDSIRTLRLKLVGVEFVRACDTIRIDWPACTLALPQLMLPTWQPSIQLLTPVLVAAKTQLFPCRV
jgi:hypothetical protein